MKGISSRSISLVVFCALCILFSGFTGDKFPAPVTRAGLANAQVVQVDSCMLIYGINSSTESFVAEMYDPQLRLIHQFNEKISGFNPWTVSLSYKSETRLEFIITDHYTTKQQYIFLDRELTPFYKSAASPKITVLTNTSVKVLGNFRIDDHEWEIRTETQDIGGSKKLTTTALYQYAIKLNPSWPMLELNRRITLDSSAVEYAKVFLVRDNKIYVYVNESTAEGKQFVYCFNGLDGALIYKTQLRVQYEDFGDPGRVESYAKSCIFSRAQWNEKVNKLMIAGTWMTDSVQQSGLFLMMFNENGTINAGTAAYDDFLNTPVKNDRATGLAGYRVAYNTYQCVYKMEYQATGAFVVFSELYGRKVRAKSADGHDLRLIDEGYHYFCVQAQYFDVQNAQIRPRVYEEFSRPHEWSANHHLDSIAGFISRQTKLLDRPIENDVNRICDGTLAGPYYQASFLSGKSSDIKLLSRNDVAVSPSHNSTASFCKIVSGAKKVNCIPFLSPDPIHGQSFSEQNDYFAIDALRLYRVTKLKDGFTLKVMAW